MTNKPTDAEIIALADETRTGEPGRGGYILPISFARAVLAKWGQPATATRITVPTNTMEQDSEHQMAIMQCERNASLDAYSRVVSITSAESRLYEAGFTNGWDRRDRLASYGQAPAQAAPATVERPSDDAVMDRTRDLAISGRWPSDWVDAYRRGYADACPHCGKPRNAPQPVEREPLTHAQAKALVLKYGNDPLHLVYQVEVAHGIKIGGQHGAE